MGLGRIANRVSSSGRPQGPIQVRVQALRGWQATAEHGCLQGLATLETNTPDDDPPEPLWRQADVERAIAVAEQAGLRTYRIEIAPDGTIAIVVGSPLEDPDSA